VIVAFAIVTPPVGFHVHDLEAAVVLFVAVGTDTHVLASDGQKLPEILQSHLGRQAELHRDLAAGHERLMLLEVLGPIKAPVDLKAPIHLRRSLNLPNFVNPAAEGLRRIP
jgi:hypothetical protein